MEATNGKPASVIVDRESILKSWNLFVSKKPADFNPPEVMWGAIKTGFLAGYALGIKDIDNSKITPAFMLEIATINLPVPQGTQL